MQRRVPETPFGTGLTLRFFHFVRCRTSRWAKICTQIREKAKDFEKAAVRQAHGPERSRRAGLERRADATLPLCYPEYLSLAARAFRLRECSGFSV
jgi:hypothetical protein